jgi:hypothetical protein
MAWSMLIVQSICGSIVMESAHPRVFPNGKTNRTATIDALVAKIGEITLIGTTLMIGKLAPTDADCRARARKTTAIWLPSNSGDERRNEGTKTAACFRWRANVTRITSP